MGVEVGNYCTTSFILKDAESVEYIKKLCNVLTDESNLSSGYLSDDAYCKFVPYGKEENSFIIKAGGFMDAGVDGGKWGFAGLYFWKYAHYKPTTD